ncbi:MAG: hypothetical protein CL846_03510 [Crocinitomicaceae bacterium]|nr:hypothetical protein [Crocinitomicaceae bacterium]|tara:strand:+ start:10184 stop:10501 length:318 start_codon:yes stop_codon:yes gene_type:complete
MVLYNVTINIDYAVHDEWLDWMKNVHIPDVMNTGLFIDSKLCKIHAEEDGGKSYSVQYLLNNWEDYNLYVKEYADELQKEHAEKYANKFVAFRTILEVVSHVKSK